MEMQQCGKPTSDFPLPLSNRWRDFHGFGEDHTVFFLILIEGRFGHFMAAGATLALGEGSSSVRSH
jgi:hypothetical protein